MREQFNNDKQINYFKYFSLNCNVYSFRVALLSECCSHLATDNNKHPFIIVSESEYMKFIYVNCGIKITWKKDHRSYIHNAGSCKNRGYKTNNKANKTATTTTTTTTTDDNNKTFILKGIRTDDPLIPMQSRL